jgi:hypothetical protein
MAGVVARGDEAVLGRHLQALQAVGPQEAGLYAALSVRSVRLAREAGRIDDVQAMKMLERLSAVLQPPLEPDPDPGRPPSDER